MQQGIPEGIPEPAAVPGNPERGHVSSDVGSLSAGSSCSTFASESPEDMDMDMAELKVV